jgi:hypothetical protein
MTEPISNTPADDVDPDLVPDPDAAADTDGEFDEYQGFRPPPEDDEDDKVQDSGDDVDDDVEG